MHSLKARSVTIVGMVATVTVIVATLLWGGLVGGPHDPAYNGKRLSEWVEGFYWETPNGGTRWTNDTQVANAVRRIGTNGLPYLISMAQPEEEAWWWKKLRGKLRNLAWLDWNDVPARVRQVRALSALKALGKQAEPALPVVMECLKRSNYHRVRVSAALVLESIGKPAADQPLPFPVICLKTNRSMNIAGEAARALEAFETEAKEAVPKLISFIKNDTGRATVAMSCSLQSHS